MNAGQDNSMLPADHAERMARARLSLEGLSIGDAFGEQFFYHSNVAILFRHRAVPSGRLDWTDDTMMALSIVDELDAHGGIDPDSLAGRFRERFVADPRRGYGPGFIDMMERVIEGEDWSSVIGGAFGGTGSFGNGSAMRIAPLGAYFADDPGALVEQARLSATVTHAHPEGQAGAIATAVAAAEAWKLRDGEPASARLIEAALDLTPDSEVRAGLTRAAALPPDRPVDAAAVQLGSGMRVSCQDTVPFCLWCASRHLHSFDDALWNTVLGHGDVDTTCAIVGGIVALAVGAGGIDPDWLAHRQPLPDGKE